ncbi:DMT family transporter [Aestuariibius sp. 2305UL40-4]|uniref:DMT family transporter n=1 Tax=Aestuariibius violaceus TaxID=3234132 RepID=UPI00345EBA2D
MTQNARGALLALAAFGLFASHDVVVKVLGGIYSPIQIVFFSVLLSFPLATLMLMRDSKPGTLLPKHPWWMAARTAAAVITALTAFYAFSVLPLAQVYTILFASPLFITILSIPILGETVRFRRWAAVIVGLVGVLVVLNPATTSLQIGHAAALTAALCGSFASVVVRKIGREERMAVIMLYPMMTNFFVLGAALAFVYEPMPIEHLGLLAVIAVLAWFATRLILTAYKTAEAVIVAPMQYSQILWATLYGLLFFEEIPETNTLIGAGIIIASGLYIVLRESRSGASETQPVLRTRSRPETGTTLRVGPILHAMARRTEAEPKNSLAKESDAQ